MKTLLSIGLCLVLLLGGCTASQYLGKTVASVGGPNGFKWESNKNQEGLKASGKLNPDGAVEFSIETTSTTPDAAIAAALQGNLAAQQNIGKLIDVGAAAGQAFATKGVSTVLPKPVVAPPVVVPPTMATP